MSDISDLNDAIRLPEDERADYESDLRGAWETLGDAFGQEVARQFRRQNESITATGTGDWDVQNVEALLLAGLGTLSFAAVLASRRRAILAIAEPALVEVSDDLVSLVIERLGNRIAEMVGTAAPGVKKVLQQAALEGLSVEQTARQIHASIDATNLWMSERIAQTEMTAIENGTALAVAQQLNAGADTPLVPYKMWITALDERVRDTHAATHGQTVPINAPFTVGGFAMQYPGDPAAPLDQTANCRCVLEFRQSPPVPALVSSAMRHDPWYDRQAEADAWYATPPAEPEPAEPEVDTLAVAGEMLVEMDSMQRRMTTLVERARENRSEQHLAAAVEKLGEGQVQMAEALTRLASSPPTVNVAPTPIEVNLPAPEIAVHVPATTVEFAAPDIHVDVPAQPAPVVNVNVPPAEVNVTVEPPAPAEKASSRRVAFERDPFGNVVSAALLEE